MDQTSKVKNKPCCYALSVIWKGILGVFAGGLACYIIKFMIKTFSKSRKKIHHLINAIDIILAFIFIIVLLIVAIGLIYCAIIDFWNTFKSMKNWLMETSNSTAIDVQDEQIGQRTADEQV